MPSSTATTTAKQLITAARRLSRESSGLDFSDAAAWVYNPLQYAWKAHEQYLKRYANGSADVLFLGMNPGPWGMAQTGVPFGEVDAVRDWLEIDAAIGQPDPEHPKRPVEGLKCPRSEVSGRRLWGLFRERFGTPATFFDEHFVTNYCPLVFMEESARNVTPDKLPAPAKKALEEVCDRHLAKMIQVLSPTWLIGIGGFAEACLKRVMDEHQLSSFKLGRILHPSPASPAANKDWAGTVTRQLTELGVWESAP